MKEKVEVKTMTEPQHEVEIWLMKAIENTIE